MHYILDIIIIIGIQPLGRSGQRPELSQVTGMALVRCKFLGVVCHCFPPNEIMKCFIKIDFCVPSIPYYSNMSL